MPPKPAARVRPWPATLLSLLVPGGGQFILGQRTRGVTIFLCVVLLGALVWWTGATVLAAPLLLLHPVSYTHLDVYKRQPFLQFLHNAQGLSIYPGGIRLSLIHI